MMFEELEFRVWHTIQWIRHNGVNLRQNLKLTLNLKKLSLGLGLDLGLVLGFVLVVYSTGEDISRLIFLVVLVVI